MDSIVTELFVVILLIAVNGFFSMSEFAIISIRKSRISQLVAEGDERAAIIENISRTPNRYWRSSRSASP